MVNLRRSVVLGLALLAALALLASACGGGKPQATTAVAAASTDEPTAAMPVAFEGLWDADAIVAAQEEVLTRIYERIVPSLVSIQVSAGLARQGEGSGFVWDDQGHIVTNHHVVDGVDSVFVVFADGTRMAATVLGSDPDADLAVLLLERPVPHLVPVPLGDSGLVRPGQMAVAIGNPLGQEFTMTTGIVSAVGRTIRSGNSPFSVPRVIQTDAAINPGNSGGPLLDRHGRVIGINTQTLSRSGSNAGIGFAVPSNLAKRVIPVLISEGRYEYGFLGISGIPVTSGIAELMDLPAETRGALVVSVSEGGPSDGTGLRAGERTVVVGSEPVPLGGDVIVAADGVPIRSMDDLIAYLIENTGPRDTVVLDVLRQGGEQARVEVTLGARPSQER